MTNGAPGGAAGEAEAGGASPDLAGIRALLGEAGLDATVRPAGHDGRIAALSLAPSRWLAAPEALRAALVARVKEAGFRYVALEVGRGPGAGEPREPREPR